MRQASLPLAGGVMSTKMYKRVLFGVLCAALLTASLAGVASAGTLHPSTSQAPYDLERLFHDGCLGYEPDTTPPSPCLYGDTTAGFRMALVGDSHTSMLFPAFQ